MYLCRRIRAISSAGSEHLVYTEGVGGSNPSLPTKLLKKLRSFFLYLFLSTFELTDHKKEAKLVAVYAELEVQKNLCYHVTKKARAEKAVGMFANLLLR
jgi:hypothetical protein